MFSLRQISYIQSIAKNEGEIFGSLYRSRKFLTQSATLCFYKSYMRPEYFCRIFAGAAQSSLSDHYRWLFSQAGSLHRTPTETEVHLQNSSGTHTGTIAGKNDRFVVPPQ